MVWGGGGELMGSEVRALAKVIVLCSWTRNFTLTVLLSTQVYSELYAFVGNLAID